jgi:hypothetical protein
MHVPELGIVQVAATSGGYPLDAGAAVQPLLPLRIETAPQEEMRTVESGNPGTDGRHFLRRIF